MAFWGTEVKPGKPFTHAPLNGRLHLSQATLGMGNGAQKSIVQCNVGNKRPVFLCSLFPDKSECCQLNLEFEESDEVVFSVVGPRNVHLTGYYLPSSSLNHRNDESESYGEDIADTETERSENSEESEYGGSFINDDDEDYPQVLPSPEPFAGSGSNEEMLDLKKSKNGKGRRRRLRKKNQNSELENDDSFQPNDFTIAAAAAVEVLDSENEDTLPISSLSRGKHASKSGKADAEEKPRKEIDNLNDNETEDKAAMLEGTNAAMGVQPECESGIRNGDKQEYVLGVDDALTSKKKREELVHEERYLESDHGMIEEVVLEQNDQDQKLDSNVKSNVRNEGKQEHVLGVDDALMSKKKREELAHEEGYSESDCGMMGEVVLEHNDQNQKLASNEQYKHDNLSLTSSQVGIEDGAKLKRKREHAEDNVTTDDEVNKSGSNVDDVAEYVHVEDKETQKLASKEQYKHDNLSLASSQVGIEDGAKLKRKSEHAEDNVTKEDEVNKSGSNVDDVTEDVHVEDKGTQKQVTDKKRKKKKRCKNKDNGDAMKMEPPVLPAHEKNTFEEMETENANDKAIELSNGIMIEEIDMGKPDGKVASLGKKVYVHYTGKFKETGQVFNSRVGKDQLKFRLGGEKVQELWHVGIDGMRVGGKRRITVPPSLSHINEGSSDNIPSNSWLVLDIELVKVR